jgi:hypothetical protein
MDTHEYLAEQYSHTWCFPRVAGRVQYTLNHSCDGV